MSLPGPNQNLVEEFDSLIYDFIWNSKPAKFGKHIVDSNITNGWLGLHRLFLELKTVMDKKTTKSQANWKLYHTYGKLIRH